MSQAHWTIVPSERLLESANNGSDLLPSHQNAISCIQGIPTMTVNDHTIDTGMPNWVIELNPFWHSKTEAQSHKCKSSLGNENEEAQSNSNTADKPGGKEKENLEGALIVHSLYCFTVLIIH